MAFPEINPAGQHTDDAAEERQGGEPSGLAEAEAPGGLQVARQPGEVDPDRVEDAERAQDHEPGVLLLEQFAPAGLLFLRLGLLFELSTLDEEPLLERGVTVDPEPHECDDHTERANDNEHATPSHGEQQEGQQRRGNGVRNLGARVDDRDRQGTLGLVEPAISNLQP
jgi:hypothetical protein